MRAGEGVVTLDSNVFVCALKADERYSAKCKEIIRKVPRSFLLSEPAVFYQEVCGTVARKAGAVAARLVRDRLDQMIQPGLLFSCDREYCISAYPLCGEFGIYAVDALYFKTAIDANGILISLDEEDFLSKVRTNPYHVEVLHPSDFSD